MQSHCQHNLFICHCSPSSGDPSPIQPTSHGSLHLTMRAGNKNELIYPEQALIFPDTKKKYPESKPVYVTQTSIAVMTSPTINPTSTVSSAKASLSSATSPTSTTSSASSSTTSFPSSMTLPRVLVANHQRSEPRLNSGQLGTSDTLGLTLPRNGRNNRQTVLRSIPENGTSRFVHHQHYRSHPVLSSPSGPTVPQLQMPQVTRHQAQHFDKYLGCHSAFWHGRSMLERVILTLLIVLLVSVFLVAGLVLVQLGTGYWTNGNFGFSGKTGNSLNFVSDHSTGDDPSDTGRLFRDDGVEIVRIKTTEEHKIQGTGISQSIVRTKKVCVTPECSDLSRKILQSVDPDKDPCSSFYSFACGGWMMRNQPPPRRMVHSVMSQMRDRVDRELKDLIEGLVVERSDEVNRKLRNFYDSCMDIESIRTKGFIPAVDFIHSNFSEFLRSPTQTLPFESDTDSREELTTLILELLRVNGTPLMDISLDLAPKNSSKYIGVIRVPQRAALLPRLVQSKQDMISFNKWFRQRRRRKRNSRKGANYKLVPRKEIFASFQNALNSQRVAAWVKTAETMGILDTSSETTKQSDIDEILGFLAALEKVLPSEKEMKQNLMSNSVYNEYNVDEMQASFRFLNWHRLLGGLFPLEPRPQDVFIVHDPTYMRKLGRIISLFGKRVVWKSLLVLYARDVLTDLVTIHHEQPRWQYCTQVSSMLFGEALSRLFMGSLTPGDRIGISNEVEVIFRLMKKRVLEKVEHVMWIGPETKQAAIDKINRLEGKFLGSDLFFNYTLLQQKYRGVQIGDDFFSNVMTMFTHFRRSIYDFIHQHVDKETYTWNLISFPFTVNAFHLQQLNSIVIPLGLIRDAHYTRNVPKYLNVGSLGLTLAHEILHSLDTTGRGFRGDGKLQDWWNANSQKNFSNVSKCVVQQYQEHFRRPLRIDARSILIEVDGDFTLNENICDIDGLNVASSAFEGLRDMSANDLVYLPNNPYTPQQLFFINTAQAYCSHVGPVSYVLYLELDEHAPNPERVDGMMMNSNLFNEVFKCPVGSRMNPPEKCSVWT